MNLVDNEWFIYGYKHAIEHSQSQINELILGYEINRLDRKLYTKCKQQVPEEFIKIFEDGWAFGSINVTLALGSWLQTRKLYISYKIEIKDMVRKMASKYKYTMTTINSDYEIRDAVLELDITRDAL